MWLSMCGSAGQFLYHNEKGMLNLDNLVVGSTSDVAYWLTSRWGPSYLTERWYVNVQTTRNIRASAPRMVDLGCLLVPETTDAVNGGASHWPLSG